MFRRQIEVNVIFPDKNLKNNICHNEDANDLIKKIKCDLLYLDPPYNSRQYSDLYHLLENVAQWKKPEVYGKARKMDRSSIKSIYSCNKAKESFEDLIKNANANYIILSYNNYSLLNQFIFKHFTFFCC